MTTIINTLGEARPAVAPTVHDRAATYTPEPEARAARVASEASHWLRFATARTTMSFDVLVSKALASLAFSVHHGARSFAVPSKLVGVRKHQGHLWQIARDGYRTFDQLEADTLTTDGVRVLYGDVPLGEVQSKHVSWVRPLVPFGLTVHLSRVTGHEVEGRTLGVNVVFGHVGPALAAHAEAVGSAAPTGDCARSRVFPVPALPRTRPSGHGAQGGATGDGATGRLRLVVPPEAPAAGPDDVVLYRSVDGTARATVGHVVRHSPSGIEWGYAGSGPADLARSVLLALVGEEAAERLYHDFKADVVARVPYAGAVLKAADVRRWVARQDAGMAP